MTAPAFSPPTAAEVLRVEAYQCEPGDRVLGGGITAVIESVLFDGQTGRWLLVDRNKRIICRKRSGQAFQIVRDGLSADDAPASGLLRPSLSLVKR